MGGKVDSKGSDEYHQYTFTKQGYVDQAQYEEMKAMNAQFTAMAPKVDDRNDPEAQRAQSDDGAGDADHGVTEDDVAY